MEALGGGPHRNTHLIRKSGSKNVCRDGPRGRITEKGRRRKMIGLDGFVQMILICAMKKETTKNLNVLFVDFN